MSKENIKSMGDGQPLEEKPIKIQRDVVYTPHQDSLDTLTSHQPEPYKHEYLELSISETNRVIEAYIKYLNQTKNEGRHEIRSIKDKENQKMVDDTFLKIHPESLPTKTSLPWGTPNVIHIKLDRKVEFEFTKIPKSTVYLSIIVIIDIDSKGGFDAPDWPSFLVNPPVIQTTPNTRTSIILYSIDSGQIVTHATSVKSQC